MPTSLSGLDTGQTLGGTGTTQTTPATDPNTGQPLEPSGTAQQGSGAVQGANQAAASMVQMSRSPQEGQAQDAIPAMTQAQGPTPPTTQGNASPVPLPASQQLGALSPMLAAILAGQQQIGFNPAGMDAASLAQAMGIDPNQMLGSPVAGGAVPTYQTAGAGLERLRNAGGLPYTPPAPAPLPAPPPPTPTPLPEVPAPAPALAPAPQPAQPAQPSIAPQQPAPVAPEPAPTPAAPAAPAPVPQAPATTPSMSEPSLPAGVPPGTQQTMTNFGPGYVWNDPRMGQVTYANGSYISSQYGLVTPELLSRLQGGQQLVDYGSGPGSGDGGAGDGGYRKGGLTPPTDAQAARSKIHKNEFVIKEGPAQQHMSLLRAINSGAEPKTLMGILRKTAATIPTPKAEAPPKPKTPRK